MTYLRSLDLHQHADPVRDVRLDIVASVVKPMLPPECVNFAAKCPRLTIGVIVRRRGFGHVGLVVRFLELAAFRPELPQ